MHALQFDVSDWGYATDLSGVDLALGSRADAVEVSKYLEGLYRVCRDRYDADTCHEILDDTHTILSQAGYSSWHQISRKDLAELIFSSTRDWEYIGESGTIDVVQAQRDYTRTVVGETLFSQYYQGLQTVDGQSYYAAVQ